jgi:hypothetical protein
MEKYVAIGLTQAKRRTKNRTQYLFLQNHILLKKVI